MEDEARHNLLLGVAGVVRDRPQTYGEARFWCVDGAAAMQTPPHNLILAKPRDRAALERLVAAIDAELPGVVGAVPEVDDFVELWGRPSERVVAQGIYALDRVSPPPSAPGAYREADDSDSDLVLDWFEAFAEEALHGSERIERTQIEAQARVAGGRGRPLGGRARGRLAVRATGRRHRTASASDPSTHRPSCAVAATRRRSRPR